MNSQLGQDQWVLTQLNGKRNGTFVDIGAHDGKHFSNTYMLEKEYGWTGVCVEANCETFAELEKNRIALCLPYAAWSKSNVMVNFQRHAVPMLSGITNHSSTTVLETKSLNDIIKAAGLSEVDYISLDTEGTEAEILSTFDWSVPVKCWSIEHNGNSKSLNYFIEQLEQHGYLFRIWHWDLLAVKDAWQLQGEVSYG